MQGLGQYLLGHPASPTPRAAVTLSEQQPYTDRLQCWRAVVSGTDMTEFADVIEAKKGKGGDGRWHKIRKKNSNF